MSERRDSVRLTKAASGPASRLVTATLHVATGGAGFTDITRAAADFLSGCGGEDGLLYFFVQHTSASLVIQENADPDVRTDLLAALRRLAPEEAGWVHDTEGPDDMPAHIKTMLTDVSLHVPVIGGRMALGTWQAVYLVEHRAMAHQRSVVLQFLGR